MNKYSKRINPSYRKDIDRVKGYIATSTRAFDGDGYIFKTALAELRKEGFLIKKIRAKCHYILINN